MGSSKTLLSYSSSSEPTLSRRSVVDRRTHMHRGEIQVSFASVFYFSFKTKLSTDSYGHGLNFMSFYGLQFIKIRPAQQNMNRKILSAFKGSIVNGTA